jgi:hypothetical protein
MLASHAALWLSTGSWETLVFQTLLAGNIGQFGAPGTTVVMTGALGCGVGVTLGRAGDGLGSAASRALSAAFSPALRCALGVDAAVQPATRTAATAAAAVAARAATRRPF